MNKYSSHYIFWADDRWVKLSPQRIVLTFFCHCFLYARLGGWHTAATYPTTPTRNLHPGPKGLIGCNAWKNAGSLFGNILLVDMLGKKPIRFVQRLKYELSLNICVACNLHPPALKKHCVFEGKNINKQQITDY